VHACAATAALLLAAAIHLLGVRQFGANDYGSIINHAWLAHLGARPYTELLSATPPLFILGGKAAFALGGVRWAALVDAAGLVAALSLAAMYFLFARAGLASTRALALATTLTVAAALPTSFWSFNATAALAASVFLASAFALLEAPERRPVMAAFVASAVALSWCKPNIAGPMLVSTAAVLAATPVRARALALLGAGAVLSIALLVVCRVDPRAALESYAAARGRASLFDTLIMGGQPLTWWEARSTYTMLAPALAGAAAATLVAARARDRREIARIALAGCGAITSAIAFGTNHELKMTDAVPFLAGAGALLFRSGGANRLRDAAQGCVALSLLLVTGFALRVSSTRMRVDMIGTFFERTDALYALEKPELLRGVVTGPRMRFAVRRIDTLLRDAGPGASVFFGPRMDWGYAAWSIAPPRDLPTWWEFFPEGSPATDAMVERFAAHKFRLLVFATEDAGAFPYYPPVLLRYLRREYETWSNGDVLVMVPRGSGRPAGLDGDDG